MKKDYSLFIIKCLTVCFVLTAFEIHSQTYDYQDLIGRVVTNQRVNISGTGTLTNWVNSQNTDGSWSDVEYGNSTNVTTTNNHVYRLWQIAAACSELGHEKYNDTDYKDAVKRGLQYWYNSNTIDSNWWYNEIYFPQYLGEILIFMREFDGFIPKTTSEGIDEPEILSLFTPTSLSGIISHGTGANAIDIGLHYVYRGLITEDGSLLENTRDILESILADNIRGDLMYQDHGPQIMTASYGWVFCDGLINLATYLAGSPAAFDTSAENFSKVLSFIRNTQALSTRGSSWDFSVMGRGVSRENALNANMNYLQNLADYIDSSNAQVYLDILDRLKGVKEPSYNVDELNKYYWASDYTQHSRSGYLFTVRNTSTRTVEAEQGNGENLKANYFSYGANFMSVDGDEYLNIMPVWDWSMIPGTTFPYTTTFESRSDWGTNYGTTSFVGGVSDGVHGASVLDLDEAGIKAKKSWFFFDDEIVCLGAGIEDNSNRNVRTTINQAWLKELSYYSEVGASTETVQTLSSNVYANTNLNYIRNGNFGYYFPNQGNVKYTMKSQTGTWQSINSNESNESQSGYVFSLWLDHGLNPSNATYSYIVVPGIDSAQKAQSYDVSAIEIVENTTSIQAVYHNTLDLLQVIFYEAGTVSFKDKSVTVNQPCALMFKNGTLVTASNPSQSYSGITVTISIDDTPYTKAVALPTSTAMKGASTTVDFQDVLAVNKLSDTEIITTFYPNPTQGLLNIESDNNASLSYKIVGVNGQIILSGQFQGKTTLDLSNITSGLYFLSIKDNKTHACEIQKIIKQ
ncbi:T9SS type A sorting domain-containing protein [Seonamhaeicola sp. NFXS20]|uniref:polysaccharide lyase family 8 super-sandwich domain-containing protein n=1 Tax=Seonamhaeicola sp. NFXS20 TaxID=2816959 RepID=UPI003B8D49C7